MLMPSHEKYHKMSPKDVGLKDTMPLQLSRVTAETGEQFTFEVPIYPDDSREAVNDRVNFALSIMQDRMEDVNKAILEAKVVSEKAHKARQMTTQVRALEKRLKRGKITQEEYDKELALLDESFGDAMEATDLEAKSDQEIVSENPS